MKQTSSVSYVVPFYSRMHAPGDSQRVRAPSAAVGRRRSARGPRHRAAAETGTPPRASPSANSPVR
eukprot:25228-Eustigmatos_ZCMA.PRE.1